MKKIKNLESLQEEQRTLERKIKQTELALMGQTKVIGHQIKKNLVSKILIPAGGTILLTSLLKPLLSSFKEDKGNQQLQAISSNAGANWLRYFNIGLSLFRAWQKATVSNNRHS